MENRQFEAQVFCGKAFKINGRVYNVSENPKNVVLNDDGTITLKLYDKSAPLVKPAKGEGVLVRENPDNKTITFSQSGAYVLDGKQYPGLDSVGSDFRRIMKEAIRENFYRGKVTGPNDAVDYKKAMNNEGRDCM